MKNPFKTQNEIYEMNIKPLCEAYEKALEEEQQKYLKGVADFFGAKAAVVDYVGDFDHFFFPILSER